MADVTDIDQAIDAQEAEGGDRVRESSDPERNAEVDRETEATVARDASAPDAELTRRIGELEREWDIERVLETNASVLGLGGLLAAIFVDRRFAVLPVVVVGFLLQHALQGWCPPLPLFRRMGVRTRQEIDAERSALRALRGDFDGLARAH